MNENQRSKTVKRVKTVGCITLAALIGFGVGWYLPQITNKAKLNSNKHVILYDISGRDYNQASKDYDKLIESMVNASKDTKTNLLNLKKRIEEINPTELMRKGDSIARMSPNIIAENFKINFDKYTISGISNSLNKKLNLYFLAKEGFESSGLPIDFLDTRIVSTYLNILIAETIKSNEIFDEKNSQNTPALGRPNYLLLSNNWREDAPRYQKGLYDYLQKRELSDNLRIKEKELSNFLDTSVWLMNNALSKSPEGSASKWIDYLKKTNEISKLLGVSGQYRKEKLDPVKTLILEYCNQKLDSINLD